MRHLIAIVNAVLTQYDQYVCHLLFREQPLIGFINWVFSLALMIKLGCNLPLR
jgi:hypothetical protein